MPPSKAILRDKPVSETPEQMTATLTDRLRGIYTVPVNDGAGLLNGQDTFTRTFTTSPINLEAAEAIDRLTAQVAEQQREIERLRRGLSADELDAVWSMIVHSWSIETREFFEHEGPKEFAGPAGAAPLMKAIHHMWKRDRNVEPLLAKLRAVEALRDRIALVLPTLESQELTTVAKTFLEQLTAILTPEAQS